MVLSFARRAVLYMFFRELPAWSRMTFGGPGTYSRFCLSRMNVVVQYVFPGACQLTLPQCHLFLDPGYPFCQGATSAL